MTEHSTSWKWYLLIALGLGIFLRLVWLGDTEYKYDQMYMFDRVQNVGVTEPLPLLGMPSGATLRNPPLSVWVFLGLAKVASVDTPLELARTVALLNCFALVLFLVLALKIVPAREQEIWFWAFVLLAVNPFAVRYHRVIWAQSTLPFFCILTWIGWWRRDRPWGALLWGLAGALLGQIHMAGFFLAAGVFLWTALFGKRVTPSRWPYWLAGALIGALPLLPWLEYVARTTAEAVRTGDGPAAAALGDWRLILELKFWVFWISDALGMTVRSFLGPHFNEEFLSAPRLGHSPTYLMGLLHVAMILAGVGILVSAILTSHSKALTTPGGTILRRLWRSIAGAPLSTDLLLASSILVFGLLVTLSGVNVHRHYLITAFPLTAVFYARLGCKADWPRPGTGRKLLAFLFAGNLIITVAVLHFIHVRGGAPRGDYGTALSRLTEIRQGETQP